MTDVRVVAAKVLLDVEARDTTLANALEQRRGDVAPADRGLLVELTTGVMRWRNALDAIVASASRRSVKTIEPEVLAVLRLGAYQIRYLDRVPDHASIDSSVRAVRALKRTSATSLVNATLRAIVRRGPAISLPARPAESAHLDTQVNYLAVTWSHPAWLVRRWITRVGFDTAESWCRFNNTTPDVTVRSLTPVTQEALISQLRDAGVAASPARYVQDAVRLEPGALGRLSPAMRAGLWVQDEAAQLVARYAGVRPPERVLDLCASPGGKTLVMAADMRRHAALDVHPLVACDHRPSRVDLLAGTLRHAGVAAVVVRLDACAPLPFGPVFDCVLLDAPCSGLGTVRREADLKWTRTAADLPALAAAQQQMLRMAAGVVAPGGRLVYATCSSEPEENDEVVDAFLAEDTRFEPGPAGPVPDELLDRRQHLATRPDRHGLEVFFAASLVRRRWPDNQRA